MVYEEFAFPVEEMVLPNVVSSLFVVLLELGALATIVMPSWPLLDPFRRARVKLGMTMSCFVRWVVANQSISL